MIKTIILLTVCLFPLTLRAQHGHIEGELLVEDVNKIATFKSTGQNSFLRLETADSYNSYGASIGYFLEDTNDFDSGYFYIDNPGSLNFGDISVDDFGIIDLRGYTILHNGMRVHDGLEVQGTQIRMPDIPFGDHQSLQYDESDGGYFYYDSSTKRHKENINTLQDDWLKILNLRPVTYTRPGRPDRWEYGYVAEELDSIGLTTMVGYDEEGLPFDVRYDKMILYLVEVLKMHHEEKEAIRNDFMELQAEVIELKTILQKLLSTEENVELQQVKSPARISEDK